MTPKIPQPYKKLHKTIKIPYFKRNNYVFFKKIDYNLKNHYKKITYTYEKYDKKGNLIDEFIHKNKKPAIIIYRQNFISEIQYWKKGEKHREWGPAIIIYDRKHKKVDEKWYINNIKLKDKEVESKKLIIDRRRKMYKLILKMYN